MKCSKCGKNENFYKDNYNRKTKLCKDCYKQYSKERKRFLKIKCVKYKGGKCEKCGYDKNYAVLEFHHKKIGEKDFSICHASRYGWERTERELDKCILLCANCHREEHYPNYKNFIFEFDHNTLLRKKQRGKLKNKKIKCLYCEKEKTGIKSGQKYCSRKCAQAARKVTEWPSKEELTNLIKIYNYSEIGRKYGVSCNSVRRWCENYNIGR